jgi:hypothetical protein
MKRSSILLAKIANDAGIPLSKAEKLLEHIVAGNRLIADYVAGEQYSQAGAARIHANAIAFALAELGADGEMVRNWLHAIDKEAGDTPAHDQDS